MSDHFRGQRVRDEIIVSLNSKNRSSGIPESVIFNLENELKNIGQIQITSIEIPLTYYVIHEGTNTLYGDFNGSNILFISGEYTPSSLAVAVQSGMVNSGLTNPTCTYDNDTYKFTLTSDDTFTISSLNGVARLMGFSSTKTAASTITSDFAVYDNSIYISPANNYLDIDEGTGGGITRFTLTPGNYTVSEMTSAVTALISGGIGLTCTYNSKTAKISISAGGGSPTFIIYTGGLGDVLGFTSTVTSVFDVATANSVLNLSGTNSIFIRSKLITDKRESKAYVDTKTNNSIGRIPVDVSPNNILTYSPPSPQTLYMGGKNINLSTIDLSIYDEDGNLLNLNGSNWSIGLKFIIY
jgi:hypothetical protein